MKEWDITIRLKTSNNFTREEILNFAQNMLDNHVNDYELTVKKAPRAIEPDKSDYTRKEGSYKEVS